MRLLCNGNGSIPEKNVVGIARHKVGRCRVREGNIFPFLSSLLKNVPTAAEKSCNSVDCKEDKAGTTTPPQAGENILIRKMQECRMTFDQNGQEWPTLVMAVVLVLIEVMVTGGKISGRGSINIYTCVDILWVLTSSGLYSWPDGRGRCGRTRSLTGTDSSLIHPNPRVFFSPCFVKKNSIFLERKKICSTLTQESSFFHVLARKTLQFFL